MHSPSMIFNPWSPTMTTAITRYLPQINLDSNSSEGEGSNVAASKCLLVVIFPFVALTFSCVHKISDLPKIFFVEACCPWPGFCCNLFGHDLIMALLEMHLVLRRQCSVRYQLIEIIRLHPVFKLCSISPRHSVRWGHDPILLSVGDRNSVITTWLHHG
jgi:hypothetical protein